MVRPNFHFSSKNNTPTSKRNKQTTKPVFLHLSSLGFSFPSYLDDFLAAINKQEIWFATMNFTYKTVSGGMRSKEVFFSYIPDHLHVNEKFGGVTAGGSFFKALEGIQSFHCRVACCGIDDLELENVLQRVSKFELDPVDKTVTPCSL